MDCAPELADAFFVLGRIERVEGNEDEARAAFLRTLELDARDDPETPVLSPEEVEAIVTEALEHLPRGVRKRLDEVPILIQPRPSKEDVQAGLDPRLFGLFDGTPTPHKSFFDQPVYPDRILIYYRCLEAEYPNREELAEQIRITTWHETAHYFGLDEDEVAALGLE